MCIVDPVKATVSPVTHPAARVRGRDNEAEEEMRQFLERTNKEEGGGEVKEFLRGRDYEGYL